MDGDFEVKEYDSNVIAIWSPGGMFCRNKRRLGTEFSGIIGMTTWNRELYLKLKDDLDTCRNDETEIDPDFYFSDTPRERALHQLNENATGYYWKFRGFGNDKDRLEFFEDAHEPSDPNNARYCLSNLYAAIREYEKRYKGTWRRARIGKLVHSRFFKKMLDEMVLAKMMSDF